MIPLPIKLSEHIDILKGRNTENHYAHKNEDFQSYLNENIKIFSCKESEKLKKNPGTRKQKNMEAEPQSISEISNQNTLKLPEKNISAEKFLQQAGLPQDEIDKIGLALNLDLKESSPLNFIEALTFDEKKINEVISKSGSGENPKKNSDLLNQISSVNKVSNQDDQIPVKITEKDIPAEKFLQQAGLPQDAIDKIGLALNLDLKESSPLDLLEALKFDEKKINEVISKSGSGENTQIASLAGSIVKDNGKDLEGEKKEKQIFSSNISSQLQELEESGLKNRDLLIHKITSVNNGETFFINEKSSTAEKVKIDLFKDEFPIPDSSVENGGNPYVSKNSSEPMKISISHESESKPDSTFEKKIVEQVIHKIGSLSGIHTGQKEISFKLYPRELGTLHLNIQSDQQNVKISIVAENNAAKQILESNLSDLKKSLLDQGINAEQFTISVGNQGESPKEQRRFEHSMLEEPDLFIEKITDQNGNQQLTGKVHFVNKNSINIIV